MFKSKHWQSEVDGWREKKRDDRGKESSFLNHGPIRWERARWWVCAQHVICSRDVCVVFAPHHWLSSTSPHGVSSAVYLRPWQELQGENGRKSDPYGGTIKLAADLQSSSKPGQDFINTQDWHPPFTRGHCALNFLLSPQQHQCLTPGCLRTDPQSWFFFPDR